MKNTPKATAPKGRGAVSNRSGRFERLHYVDDDALESIATSVEEDRSREILSRNDSPDVPFSVSINPYRGCEHGCIYCFARPTHAYLGYSAGLDFETKILSKPRAADILRKTFAKPSYRPEPIALGANTDPYQPLEKDLQITRHLLEVFFEHDHPVAVVTKSYSVLRDLDLLASMAAKGLAHLFVSVTTLDSELAHRMEPRASSPSRRIEAIREASAAGVPVGVLASPMIPGLNDAELERILGAAGDAGASAAGYILLRLPLELKELFHEWLEEHYPDKASHVWSLMRQSRGGDLYRSEFGSRMRGEGAYAELLARRFKVAATRNGLTGGLPPLDVSRFKRPVRSGDQLGLFDR